MFQSVRAKGFRQPALDRLAARGVTLTNHNISSAVCTPSRGVIYSGLAPQVTGIQEEMMFGWTPSLPTNAVSMGIAMKRLGYELRESSSAYKGILGMKMSFQGQKMKPAGKIITENQCHSARWLGPAHD